MTATAPASTSTVKAVGTIRSELVAETAPTSSERYGRVVATRSVSVREKGPTPRTAAAFSAASVPARATPPVSRPERSQILVKTGHLEHF